MNNTPNYNIDYNDERFQNVENEKQAQLSQMNNAYGEIINNSDQFYQSQIDAVNDYKNTQSQIQQEQTDFAIEQINQQKDQATKDYTKEQKGSYVDYQKATNEYGVNAEVMAAQGLSSSGVSESSKVSMYNTYQNRVSTARESYNQAILNYNNSIKEAQLANNSKLAEIAYNALQQSLELSLEGLQYKNSLLLEQINKQQEIDNTYYNRWQNVLSQMNTEKALAENVRQYNESLAQQKAELEETKRQYEQDYALKTKQYQEDIRQFNEQIAYYKAKDAEENRIKIQQLEEQKRQAQQEQANWEKEYQLQVKQVNASLSKASSSKSSGSSSTKLTNGSKSSSSSSSLSNSSSSKSTTTSQKAASTAEYNNVKKLAMTNYNALKRTNPRGAIAFVEDIVARSSLNDSQITKLYKELGISSK